MAKSKRAKKVKKKPERTPSLYEGFSKCLESGHVSKDSFEVDGRSGIKKLHACSQCGMMYWEE